MEALPHRRGAFVADLQTPAVAQRGQALLDHVAALARAAAVGGAAGREQRLDPPPNHLFDRACKPVAPVDQQLVGLAPWPTPRALDLRQCVEHRDRRHLVPHVRRGRVDPPRRASGVGHQVALTAVFTAIRGVRPGVAPPFTARTEAESITAVEPSNPPALPRCCRINRCSRSQTPAAVQSRIRRQQVEPLTPKHSVGRSCHPMPVLSTKMMPPRHRRSSTKSLPPAGCAGCGGKRPTISCHKRVGNQLLAHRVASLLRRRKSSHNGRRGSCEIAS